jgi:hypothetical protein
MQSPLRRAGAEGIVACQVTRRGQVDCFERSRGVVALVCSAPMGTREDLNARLFAAVEQGDAESARAALEAGADARYTREESDYAYRVETPVLFLACAQKHLALVDLLLAQGADPNACFRDDESWHQKDTCLRAAMPSLDIVRLLLEWGADPNQPSEAGESARLPTHALEDAAASPEIAALLRSYGADVARMPSEIAARARQQAAEAKRQQSVRAILAGEPSAFAPRRTPRHRRR